MAGLLDMALPGGYDAMLPPEAQRDASIRGLLGFANGLGAASGPQPAPLNFGNLMAAGGQAGLNAQDAAEKSYLQKGLFAGQAGKLQAEVVKRQQQMQFIKGMQEGSLADTPANRALATALDIDTSKFWGGIGERPFDVQSGPNGLNLAPGAAGVIGQRTIAAEAPKTGLQMIQDLYKPHFVPTVPGGRVEEYNTDPGNVQGITRGLLGGQLQGLLTPALGPQSDAGPIISGNGGSSTLRGGAGNDDLSTPAPTQPNGMQFAQGLPAPSRRTGGVNPNVPPGTVFNLDNKQQDTESATVGKGFGEMYLKAQTRALENIPTERANWQRLDALLDKTYTGAGGNTLQDLKRIGQALGMNLEGVGEADAARAISNELALGMRNPSGGAGMPGALSDSDRKFLTASTAGLETTKVGRKLMIDMKLKLLDREDDVAREMRAYRKANGKIDEGLFDKLSDYSKANPLFKQDDIDRVTQAIPKPMPQGGFGLNKNQVYSTAKGNARWTGTDFEPVD